MDGVHDLGGAAGFGPVEIEPDEPTFHADWEGRVFALAGVVLGATDGNTPMFRHGIERMDPRHYLGSSYFEHWLTSIATLAVEAGVVDGDALAARADGFPLSRPVAPDPIPAALADEPAPRPRFAVGDRVRVRNVHPRGHTRLPGFVRNHVGVVVRVGPDSPIAEFEAHQHRRVVEPAYCVRFTAGELWGDEGGGNAAVHVDLYDRYLDPP